MEYTPFAGLTALDENDPIAIDGASFLIRNPHITDHLLQVGAVSHRHDAHAALPNPTHAVTGSISPTGGSLSNDTYAVTYTVMDSTGGETTPAPPLSLTVGVSLGAPTIAPIAVPDYTGGIMPAGVYYYAMTYTDGAGGETTIGPTTSVYVDPGFASGSVDLSGLATELHGAMSWRLWRSYEGADWHLVTEASTATFVDDGFDPPDNPARPPEQDTTNQQASIAVTLPTTAVEPALAQGTSINVYVSPDTAFIDPCLYAQLPISAAGTTLSITDDTIQEGSPPHVSTATPGAAKIDPDTDILNWYWKAPVATATSLPTTGNNDGDARVTRDTSMIWIWHASTHTWVQWNPIGSTLASSQHTGSYTLAIGDAGTVVEFIGSSAATLTIPANVLVGFPQGTIIEVFQYGTGLVTVAAGSGVTLRSDGAHVNTAGQYATISLRQRAIDEWVLSGDLA